MVLGAQSFLPSVHLVPAVPASLPPRSQTSAHPRDPLRPRHRRSARRRRRTALRRDRHRAAGGRCWRARPTTPSRSTCRNLPRDRRPTTGVDPYEHAASHRCLARGGGARHRPEPAIWAMTQDYTGPDGERAPARHPRRVRVEDLEAGQALPHERTLPGPKRTGSTFTRPPATTSRRSSPRHRPPWPLVAPAIDGGSPGTRHHGPAHRDQGLAGRRPQLHAAVHELLDGAQLLIADGHHRYETAIAYRARSAARATHNYTLMALTGLDDPGLTVFPTHRMLSDLAEDPERQRRSATDCVSSSTYPRSPTEESRPARRGGRRRLRPLRLPPRPRLPAAAQGLGDRRPRRTAPGKPEAYRRLDAAILETLVLRGSPG